MVTHHQKKIILENKYLIILYKKCCLMLGAVTAKGSIYVYIEDLEKKAAQS